MRFSLARAVTGFWGVATTRSFDGTLSGPDAAEYLYDSAQGDSISRTDSRDLVTRMSCVSTMLRTLGAVLVAAATSTFMLQQWNEGSDVIRYLTLLAVTAMLAGAGFVCGIGVRESRGARTFLALVIAAVPIHFAVLGGLIQSQFPWDHTVATNAPWNADTPITALWLTGVGIAALIPLTWLSMLALVRPHARRLTWAFIAVNLALLLPVRDTDLVAWLIAGMFLLFSIMEWRISNMGHAVSTREGTFVRAMMLAPVAIIIGRTVLWYEPTFLFAGLVLLSGALACFEWIPKVRRSGVDVTILQLICAAGAVLGWLSIFIAIYDAFSIPSQFTLLLLALPASGLLMLLSTRCVTKGTGYRSTATLVAVGPALVNLVIFWDPAQLSVARFGSLVVGIVFVAYGVYGRRLTPLILGTIATAGGFIQFFVAAIEIENLFHWGSLAIVGAFLIFAAALCERYAQRIVAYAGTIHDRIREWEY